MCITHIHLHSRLQINIHMQIKQWHTTKAKAEIKSNNGLNILNGTLHHSSGGAHQHNRCSSFKTTTGKIEWKEWNGFRAVSCHGTSPGITREIRRKNENGHQVRNGRIFYIKCTHIYKVANAHIKLYIETTERDGRANGCE